MDKDKIHQNDMPDAHLLLSSRTELDKLLVKMLKLVMSFSGAERAVLLIKKNEDWYVQVVGDNRTNEHKAFLNEPFDPASADNKIHLVPAAIFNYCLRSKGVLLSRDAMLDDRFAGDRTVKDRNIRSMACIPVLNQGELAAILYLDSRQMTDVFTQENVEILTHMSAQFGVSMENILLYESLSRKVQDLQESEKRYELAVSGSDAGIWDWDISADEFYVSERLFELLGFAPDEISITMDEFWGRLHPDDQPDVRQTLEAHLEKQIPFRMDYRLLVRSGEYRWFHARGQALLDKTGKATRMSGSLTDIDQRKRMEAELMQSEERFRNLMEQSPLAMEILDPEGQIIQVNSTWLDLWGVNEEEAAQVLESYNMLTDEQLVDLGVMPLVERAFAGENIILPLIEYDANITVEEFGLEGLKDLEVKAPWIQSHLYPIRDAKGEIAYVVNTYMDLTNLKHAEQEAQEQRETLARVDRTTRMGQLAGSIAHELNQPLTGILSTAQAGEIMLRKDQCEPDEMAEILAAIAADAKRAGKVIHSLRELYRDQKREYEPVDVNNVINETIHLLQSELIRRHVHITTRYSPSAAIVKGNKVQIQQILLNLIMNSNEAMSGLAKEERHLHVELERDEKEIRVWVQDSGPGIDADKIGHIFEPLTTWKPGGTGMGLAMSQSIVRTHGGKMWAENRPEDGARVGFTLPLLEEEPQA